MFDYVTIAAPEAESHFAELGERAAHGEHILITRDQKPWFVMAPAQSMAEAEQERRNRQSAAIREMIAFGEAYRAKHGPTKPEEIKAWINEGRRF